jgi:O-antigen ligase
MSRLGAADVAIERPLPARERVVCALLILSMTLGSLINVGTTTVQRTSAVVIVAVGLLLALPGGSLRTTSLRAVAFWAFAGCLLISLLRFAASPIPPVSARTVLGIALMITAVTGFAFCALLAPADRRTRQRRLRCALYSPACFIAINLGLYAVGFSFPSTGQSQPNNGSAQLLGLLGIHTSRVNNMPLSPGSNGTGEAAALAIVICAALSYRSRGAQRLVAVSGILASIPTILLVDSRGPLAYALLALAIVAFVPRRSMRGIAFIPLLLPIAPAIILFVAGQVGSLSSSLSRNAGNGSFVTATGRSKIWSTVVHFLSHPHAEDLIGYGAYGQVRSGLGAQYAYLFRYVEHPEFANVHNIALQTVLDMGYIGLVVYLFFLMVVINSARVSHQRAGTPESAALLAALIALSLFGASEALPGLAGVYLLFSLLVLGCAAIRVQGVSPAAEGRGAAGANRMALEHRPRELLSSGARR